MTNIKTCLICHRILNNPIDPLSEDYGGNCWGCIIPAEGKNIWGTWISKLRDRIIVLEKELVEFKIDESILKAVAGKLDIKQND